MFAARIGATKAMAATNEAPRTALVTGAARRIGRAIAIDLPGYGLSDS